MDKLNWYKSKPSKGRNIPGDSSLFPRKKYNKKLSTHRNPFSTIEHLHEPRWVFNLSTSHNQYHRVPSSDLEGYSTWKMALQILSIQLIQSLALNSKIIFIFCSNKSSFNNLRNIHKKSINKNQTNKIYKLFLRRNRSPTKKTQNKYNLHGSSRSS